VRTWRPQLCALASILIANNTAAWAGEITATVTDRRGAPVEDAVVYATPRSGKPPQRTQTASIAHQNQQFVPYVTAVQAGALINLPNLDPVKHHAYSISPPRKFELPLYSGTPKEPLLFDKPGIVAIGCNIHDWMSAYVCVLETPFFAITGADGNAQLRGLAAGAYDVEVWQPRLKGEPSANKQQVTVAGPAKVEFALDLKAGFRPRRNPAASNAAYR
jgi:plastocyanin